MAKSPPAFLKKLAVNMKPKPGGPSAKVKVPTTIGKGVPMKKGK